MRFSIVDYLFGFSKRMTRLSAAATTIISSSPTGYRSSFSHHLSPSNSLHPVMKKATPVVDTSTERKGHVCPPSDATHPRDRWETLFIYSFICKFTQLRSKVEGLESPMEYVPKPFLYTRGLIWSNRFTSSFEEALLAQGPHPIMVQVVTRFILNLRPQTRNIR